MMRQLIGAFAGIALLVVSAGAADAVGLDRKRSEIAQNFELAEQLATAIAALGPNASQADVLALISAMSVDVDMTLLAAALDLAAAWQDWPPQVQTAFQVAIDAALVVLAVREHEATGASVEASGRPSALQTGGYGASWGSGGSGYTY